MYHILMRVCVGGGGGGAVTCESRYYLHDNKHMIYHVFSMINYTVVNELFFHNESLLVHFA